MDLNFFNPYAEIHHTEHRLPHWQQAGAVYFLTFRLADAVPAHLLAKWDEERAAWQKLHPPPLSEEQEMEYHRRFSGAVEKWLDAGHGACVLRQPACAAIVANALRHFDGGRCAQVCWVVMPNHVHTIVVQHPDWPVEKLLHSWKSFSAKEINKALGRTGELWQRSYFDRLVRDARHFANCVRYVRRNPAKARLREGEFVLWESDLAKAIE